MMTKEKNLIEKYIPEADVEDIDVENPGILEVPEDEDVMDLPLSHFKDLVERKGYEEIIRAIQNLRR